MTLSKLALASLLAASMLGFTAPAQGPPMN